MTTTYPIQTFIGTFDATSYIPKEGLRVASTRGKLVGSSSFTLEEPPFSISNWQVVQIFKADMSERLFYGYIASHSKKKRGVVYDYKIECQSLEVRLQKANVTGSFSGTDSEIITALFAAATPDLTNLFDLSGISDISLADLLFEFNDTDLLSAIDEVAQNVGAEYSFDNTGGANTSINLFKNPNFNTDTRFSGSNYAPDDFALFQNYNSTSSWIEGNEAWVSNAGVGGTGGMVISSQGILAGRENAYFRIGRTSSSNDFTFNVANGPSTSEIRLNIQLKRSNAGSVFTFFVAAFFDEDSNFISSASLGNIPSANLTTSFNNFELNNVTLDEVPVNAAYFEIFAEFERFTTTDYDITVDQILVEIIESAAGASTYFDGDTSGYVWDGTTNRSTSSGQPGSMAWDTPPDAPYDVDIGNMNEVVGDFDFDFPSFDGINSLIVVGGTSWEDVDWIYEGNAVRGHWDLELKIFPADGASLPVIYRNTGTNAVPIWTAQTVQERAGNSLGVGNDLLLDSDGHWVEWNTAPPAFDNSWRVVGRIQLQIRATVKDDALIESQGVELVDVVNDPTLTTTDQAFDVAQAELEARAAPEQITFTSYEPGIFAGQEIDIVDSAQGVTVTMLIESVEYSFLGGGYVKIQVAAGQRTPDLGDIMANTYDMAEGRPPYTVDAEALPLDILWDFNEEALLDSDGQTLYQQS